MNWCLPRNENQIYGEFTYERKAPQNFYLMSVPMGDKNIPDYPPGVKTYRIGCRRGATIWKWKHYARWPRKNDMGKEQMDWFKKTVIESDATFKVVISPYTNCWFPIGQEKWQSLRISRFQSEGDACRKFIGGTKEYVYRLWWSSLAIRIKKIKRKDLNLVFCGGGPPGSNATCREDEAR